MKDQEKLAKTVLSLIDKISNNNSVKREIIISEDLNIKQELVEEETDHNNKNMIEKSSRSSSRTINDIRETETIYKLHLDL